LHLSLSFEPLGDAGSIPNPVIRAILSQPVPVP
jgi:hypothetical protein